MKNLKYDLSLIKKKNHMFSLFIGCIIKKLCSHYL